MKAHKHHNRILPPDDPTPKIPWVELLIIVLFVALAVALWRVAP